MTVMPVVVAVVMMVTHAHIDTGCLGRSGGNRTARHQRRRQRNTCKKMLHSLTPDSALSTKVNARSRAKFRRPKRRTIKSL
jgi:hypothetical protein